MKKFPLILVLMVMGVFGLQAQYRDLEDLEDLTANVVPVHFFENSDLRYTINEFPEGDVIISLQTSDGVVQIYTPSDNTTTTFFAEYFNETEGDYTQFFYDDRNMSVEAPYYLLTNTLDDFYAILSMANDADGLSYLTIQVFFGPMDETLAYQQTIYRIKEVDDL